MAIATACAAGAVAAAIPAAASASVQVGSSGWQWGNPLPQGNTLRSMSFAGNDGYAAGAFGTLLRTQDGGSTWTGLLSGTYTDLTQVQAIDANSLFAGGGCVARRSDDGGATFRRIAFTPVESSCREQLVAGWFVSEQKGFLALTDGTVLTTDNNGDTFAQKNPLPGTRAQNGGARPTTLVFTDPNTGIGATDNGKLFRTTDGANSWTQVADNGRAVRAVRFFDAANGVAVGDGSLFLTTKDGGMTWTPKALGIPPTNLTSITCATQKLCVMTTDSGTALVRTDDGGATATLVTASPDPIFAAAFASLTRIAATGATGATAVSDDGGKTFAPVGGRLTGRYSKIRAGGQAGSAFAPGDNGSLAKTTDGGRTWTRGNVSTPEDVLDVAFPTTQTGFALDVAGGLFRTNDGAASWKALDTGTTARPNAVNATSASRVLLVGPIGMRRSTDGGDTFSAVTDRDVTKKRLTAIDRAGSALFASGLRDLLRSTDGGKTWTPVHKPGRVRAVDFVSSKVGFLIDDKGTVWHTTNAGKSWSSLPGVGTDGAYGIAFSSAGRGYLVIDRFGDVIQRSGFLLTTSDSGRTWHPQLVVAAPIAPAGIASPGGGTDYLLGGESSLLFTTTRGGAGKPSTLSVRTKKTQLSKPAGITVTGRLSPASGGERVTVSYRAPGRTTWRHQTVKTAANGSYTTSWRVAKGTNTFVAQWAGNFRSQGDGSTVLSVRVGH
ncbi:MAG: WD40/YVTN/BNR-like repeat-containing protein [Solirubrobacteraceae bacterium]